ETEVRSFLRRVSEELAVGRAREQELEAALDALEEQLRAPRPLSEQELLDALGEETARLLRSAREASDDIRAKAEERAARLVEEAADAAERTRSEAEELLASRVSEAEAIDVAAEIAAEIEKLDIAVPGELDDATGTPAPGDARAEGSGEGRPADDAETDVASALADVDTLFAQLRAGHDDPETGAGGET